MRYYEVPLTGELIAGSTDFFYGLIGTVVLVELGTFIGSVSAPNGYSFAVAIPFFEAYQLPFEFSDADRRLAGKIGPPLSIFLGSIGQDGVFHISLPPNHILYSQKTAYMQGTTLLGIPASQAWHWVENLSIRQIDDPNRWVRPNIDTEIYSFVEIPAKQFVARINPSFRLGTCLFAYFGEIADDRPKRFALPVAEEIGSYVLLSIPFWFTDKNLVSNDVTYGSIWTDIYQFSGAENIIGFDENEIYMSSVAFGRLFSYCRILNQPKLLPTEYTSLKEVITPDGWFKCVGIIEFGSVAPTWWPAIAFVIGSVWSCHELPLQPSGYAFEGSIRQKLRIGTGILIPQGYRIIYKAEHIALQAAVAGSGLVFQSCWARGTWIEWIPKVNAFIENLGSLVSEALATDAFILLFGPTDGPFIYYGTSPLVLAHLKSFLTTDYMTRSVLNEQLGLAESYLYYKPISGSRLMATFRRSLDGDEPFVAELRWDIYPPSAKVSGIRFVDYQAAVYGRVYYEIPNAAWYYDNQVEFYYPPSVPPPPPTPEIELPQDTLVDISSLGGVMYQDVWSCQPYPRKGTFVGTIIVGGFWYLSNEAFPWEFHRISAGTIYIQPALQAIDFRTIIPEVKVTFEIETISTEFGDREISYIRISNKVSPNFVRLFRAALVFDSQFEHLILPLSARVADASCGVLTDGPYVIVPSSKPQWQLFQDYTIQGTTYRWALQLGVDWQNPTIVNPGDTFVYTKRSTWPTSAVKEIFRNIVARKLFAHPIYESDTQSPAAELVAVHQSSLFYSHPPIVGCSELGIRVSGSYHAAPLPFAQIGQIADLGTVIQFASTYNLTLWEPAQKLFLAQMEGTVISLYGTMTAIAIHKPDPTNITSFLNELASYDQNALHNALVGGPHLREPGLFYIYAWNYDNPYNTSLPTRRSYVASYGSEIYYAQPALPSKDAFATGTLFYGLTNMGTFGSASWLVSDVALAFGTDTWTLLRDEFGNLDLKKVLCRGSYVHPSPLIFGSCVRLIFPFTGVIERLPAGNIRRFNIEPFMHQFYSAVFAGTMTALDSEVVLLRKVITMGNNKVTLLPRFADMPAGRVFYFTQDGGNCPLWMGEPIIGVDGVPLDDGRIRVFVYSVRGVYSFYLSINGVYDWTFDAIPRWFQTLLRGEQ